MERLTLRTSTAALDDAESTILIPPAGYIDAVRRTLGVIDLDPCSTTRAQTSIDAQGWYRAEEATAALAEPWSGRVFLHPHPNSAIARYQLQKLVRDYLADRVSSAIILAGKSDWLRQEPLLLSFPFLLHYKRLPHWRFDAAADQLIRVNPSFNSVTIYLPAKSGAHFDEDRLALFIESFSSYGRTIIAEDLGDDWQQDALLASARFPIKPILTTARLERYSATPGALVGALFEDELEA
ncbi:MAG: hypothetical protein LW834_16995 [Cyanobium sp. 49614_E6]|jgi:hypothetical protein|nr:hypothetical protein [Cyanobium sp. 49614_E6]